MLDGRFITLGVETSCDETSVAFLADAGDVLCNLVASQVEMHAPFGGVVPELAARQHEAKINPLFQSAMEAAGIRPADIDLIGVTVGPGLSVSLGVGIAFARMLGELAAAPCVGVNHLQAHLAANFLDPAPPELPAVGLLASGGHTEIYFVEAPLTARWMGGTIDDAAGEAFDKVARMAGLGYPGGPAIQKASAEAVEKSIVFPRPMLDREGFDFSFSGLKTAVLTYLKRNPGALAAEIAFAFQEAAVDVLVEKTLRAARERRVGQILLCGGVAANRRLRERFAERCAALDLRLRVPSFELCTDNAAMVAKTAYEVHNSTTKGYPLIPAPNLLI